jgi:hypothetical protein
MKQTVIGDVKMKKLLLMSIFFAFVIVVPMSTMAGADIIFGISRPPIIVFKAPPEVKVMPASYVYIVADVDADRPQANSTGKDEKGQNESSEKGKTGKDEKRQNESLEKGKTTESKGKSNWKINVLPPPDNMKSPIDKKEDQFHLPPDRF